MRVARWATMSVAAMALAFAGAAGDEPRREGRISAAVGSAARRMQEPGFVMFGWLSPPLNFPQRERIAELAAAGLNLMLPTYGPIGRLDGRLEDNLAKLDAAAAVGAKCLVWDERVLTLRRGGSGTSARLDSIVADYRDHPGFFAYYLGDEPTREWVWLRGVYHELRERDPSHRGWNNLLGRAAFSRRAEWFDYTRWYLDSTMPAILCNDHYDFKKGQDRGTFVENAAGLAALGREYGIPFWSIVQLVQHRDYRALAPGELRWQIAHLLAYGARGIGFFTYWTPRPDSAQKWQPAMIDRDGRRTRWYKRIAAWAPRLHAAGGTLARLTWIVTEHAGSMPIGGTPFAPDDWIAGVEGRAALGHFVDRDGVPYLLVANSDSLAARTVTLALGGAARTASRLRDAPGSWKRLAISGARRLRLDLEPGGFELLRLDGHFDRVLAGRVGPLVSADRRPGEVRLPLSRLGAGARLEIVDAEGRRILGRALAAEFTQWTWRGECDDGSEAAPGLYFARVEDERGLAFVRVDWSGR